MIRVFVSLGIEKVRLTGGEPLLRKGIIPWWRELAELRPTSGNEPLDLAVTTNGHLLAEMAAPLARAGLSRITVSMDAVDSANSSASPGFRVASTRCWPECAPPNAPGSGRSR